MAAFSKAFEQKKLQQQFKAGEDSDWKALGPKNIGGRTLCLAFNPFNPKTMYAGSASGGLWKTYTGGEGVVAWEQVPIDFPVLGIGAIAIAPNDSNTLYIGTGEVYNYENSAPGCL